MPDAVSEVSAAPEVLERFRESKHHVLQNWSHHMSQIGPSGGQAGYTRQTRASSFPLVDAFVACSLGLTKALGQ